MDKKNKIIISIGAVVIAIATFLIVALVKNWNEGTEEDSTGYYTLQPTTTQALPVDTSSWIDVNLIASDIAAGTSESGASTSSTDVSSTTGVSSNTPGYFFDAYGNLVDIYGNIVYPNYLQQGNQNQGGNNSGDSTSSVDNTQAFDTPVTEESELEEFEIDEQGVITAYLGDKTNLIIKPKIQGKIVTGIDEGCFAGSDIESVQIPDTVEYIGDRAFKGCTRLKYVSFVSESVKVSIGVSAFEGCSSLTSIRLPQVALYNMAFARCSALKTVELASGSTQIGGYAFSDCTSLEYIKIPSTIEEKDGGFGTNIFAGCKDFYIVADLDSDAYDKFTEAGYDVRTHE